MIQHITGIQILPTAHILKQQTQQDVLDARKSLGKVKSFMRECLLNGKG